MQRPSRLTSRSHVVHESAHDRTLKVTPLQRILAYDFRNAPMSPSPRPLRIAFVMHVMQVAGAEMLVAEIIRRLGAELEPCIICLDDVGQLGEQLRREGIEVIALGRRPGFDRRIPFALASMLRDRRIEIVHAHQYTPFFYSALAKALGGRSRLVFTEHGRHYPDVVSAKRRVTNRLLLRRFADRTTAVCEFSARSLVTLDGFAPGTVEVVENGIVLPEGGASRAELRQRFGLAADREYVICVARFHPVKDHATLLRGFALAAAKRPTADLLLAGDGPLRGALEAQARSLGIAERVRFLGVRGDVPDLLRASDVFTLSSVSEAASLTLLEAMAAELAAVVTDVGGNPELVRRGVDGLLVPRGDHEALGDALTTLLSDPARRAAMGGHGRRRVEELFLLERTVSRYRTLYHETVGSA